MIKGLQPRVTELGKIKIGKKEEQERTTSKGATWRAPQKLDHFLITTTQRDGRGDLITDEALMQRLATEHASDDGLLREIPITLLSDDIGEVFQSNYVYYAGRKVIARSDGETITWLCDPKTLEPLAEPRVAQNRDRWVETAKDGKGNRLFKPHGTLNCVIASASARWGGVYKFRTTSIISIEQLYGSLVHIQQLTGGVLQGIPLRLVVRPVEVSPDGKATTVYVVHVELRGSDLGEIQRQAVQLAQMRLTNARQLQAAKQEYLRLLRAPGENEPEDEQADVAEEFHPGPQNAKPPEVARTIDVTAKPVADDEPGVDPHESEHTLAQAMRQAHTVDELKTVGQAVRDYQLPSGGRERLAKLYGERLAEMSKPEPKPAQPRRAAPVDIPL